jgi:serine protease AprX
VRSRETAVRRSGTQGVGRILHFLSLRRRSAVVTAVAAVALVLSGLPAAAGLLGLQTTRVILTGPGISTITSLVNGLGGTVVNPLPIINGVEADVPTVDLGLLGLTPGLLITSDLPVSIESVGASAPSRAPAAVFPQTTGATQLWAQGVTGQGVAVAVLDTGIDPLPDFAGRLIDGVDLTGGGNPFQDSYGHGTFVAGLIAGNGASSGGQYTGEAPGANLVSVKTAGPSGTTDMATVILGVGWTVAHEASDHIGVLNMSLGMRPFTSTVLNPLDMAVEAAWRSGITVVVSAGNAGPFNGTILSPGDDPLVITAGALDDQGTAAAADDTIPAFSSVGPTAQDGWFKPDLVAAGRSVVSLRAPGSTIDQQNPSARIGSGNFVGSGTSFSAAVTSGAAALLLQNASLTGQPNAIKALLLGTAAAGPVGNPFVDGHGSLNVYAAATSGPITLSQSAPTVPTLPGVTVPLEATWSVGSWNGSLWGGSGWTGGFVGTTWNGTTWNGTTWNGTTWNGTTWNGTTWNGTTWNGTTWNGEAWDGTTWNGTTWNGTTWNSSTWG